MNEINITVKNKVAKGDGSHYVCGNGDYTVRFAFDEEWERVSVKTARFVKEDAQYTDVIFQGDACPMPILFGSGWIYVGVFAGNLKTTTPATIRARKSILDMGGTPEKPSPNVYAQIMEKLNSMESGMSLPAGGTQGQVLCKQSEEDYDVTWQELPQADLKEIATENFVKDYAQPKGDYALKKEIPAVPVQSVNGKTGVVNLSAADVGALPSGAKIPSKTSDLTNDSGYLTGYTETDPTVPAWAKATSKPSYTKSEVGLGNVENVKQYSDSNPPPYPVASVNGKTGVVSLTASDVGARPSTWIPTASDVGALPRGTKIPSKTSDLTNDSGYLTDYTETDPTVPAWAKEVSKPSYTKSEVGLGNVENVKQYSASNPPPYPVASVNGKTGAVSLTASDVGARPSTWIPTAANVGAVPTSRKVNGKGLSADVTLSATDVGAVPATNTLAVTGVDADGVTHTWTIYGVSV